MPSVYILEIDLVLPDSGLEVEYKVKFINATIKQKLVLEIQTLYQWDEWHILEIPFFSLYIILYRDSPCSPGGYNQQTK